MRVQLGLYGLTRFLGLAYLAFADSNLTAKSTTQQILRGDFKPPQAFKNLNLVRNTNLDKGYVRETINVVVENVDTASHTQYYLPFEYDVIGKISGLEVRDKKNAAGTKFETETLAQAAVLSEDTFQKYVYLPHCGTSPLNICRPTQYFLVHFPEPLAPRSQITLQISYFVLSSLEPLPSTIKQDGKQYLTYSFSAYVPSAYTTLKQKTKIKFPTTDVPEYTITNGLTSSSDPERQGSSFTYGTYDTGKIPPGTTYPIQVRYEFTKPILACSLLERDIEVSHWGGNLATEERYWLRNDAARLANHFSRVIWATQSYYNAPTSALKELKIPLRQGSVDPYFTDDIGNVSTSRYRPGIMKDALLELKPRYPVFGGWKYSFRIGWNNALSGFLRKLKSGDTFVLNVPFIEGPKMPEGVQYDRVEVRAILPEGATNLRWTVQGGAGLPVLTAQTSLHKTFMDTLGRSELKLTALNMVDEARDAQLIVSCTQVTRLPH